MSRPVGIADNRLRDLHCRRPASGELNAEIDSDMVADKNTAFLGPYSESFSC